MVPVLILVGLLLCACILATGLMGGHPPGASVTQAMDFPLPGVAEALADREGIPLSEAKRLETEFRRWFAIAAASPVRMGMGSKPIDAFWHALLERPDLYESYCRAVSGRVLEHIEGIGGESLDARSWVAYESLWGAPPPADLWPRPSDKALRQVRASVRRSSKRGSGGNGGDDSIVYVDVSDADSGHEANHHHGGADGGSHGHGSDGGGHGCCGGHGCGGGH